MRTALRDLVVLSNEARQVMLLSADNWDGQPLPVGVTLRPTESGIEVIGERGAPLGIAPREAETALRDATVVFLGHATPDGVATDRVVAAAFLTP